MATLVDIDTVKNRAGVSDNDVERNQSLSLALDAAEKACLARTRFTITGGQTTMTIKRVRQGIPVKLPLRPVLSISSLTGRLWGGSESSQLAYDLIDPNSGVLVVIGSIDMMWPPGLTRTPLWRKRRDFLWDQITVTADIDAVTTSNVDPRLQNAIVDLAAYWFERGMASAKRTASMEGVFEVYLEYPIPPWVSAQLLEIDGRDYPKWV